MKKRNTFVHYNNFCTFILVIVWNLIWSIVARGLYCIMNKDYPNHKYIIPSEGCKSSTTNSQWQKKEFPINITIITNLEPNYIGQFHIHILK